MVQIDATKKVIADIQSVLFEADNQLDKVLKTTPNLESVCEYILTTYMRTSPNQDDVDKLVTILKTQLLSNFNVDINKF